MKLSPAHIQTLFQSRNQLPDLLNRAELKGLGVEVGVQRGVNASRIRAAWEGEKMFCVDPWRPYLGVDDTQEMHDSYLADAKRALDGTGKPYEIMRMPSLEGAAALAASNTVLDFCYLDGDHFYEAVIADIEAWWPLVKEGGILSGHDFVSDGWHRNGDPHNAYATKEEAGVGVGQCGPFGVIKAVQELFGAGGKYERQVYLTDAQHDQGWRSWLVVK